MSHKLSILIWAAPTSTLNIVVVEMKLSIRPLTTTTTMAARHGKEGAHYTCPPPPENVRARFPSITTF